MYERELESVSKELNRCEAKKQKVKDIKKRLEIKLREYKESYYNRVKSYDVLRGNDWKGNNALTASRIENNIKNVNKTYVQLIESLIKNLDKEIGKISSKCEDYKKDRKDILKKREQEG